MICRQTVIKVVKMTNDMSRPRPAPPHPVSSPCIMVCTIDGASGLCLGCYRSLKEITEWSRLPEDERQRLMQELASRVEKIDPALRG